MLTDILYFILTLSILVTFHEYGHFWVARRCGVKVLRFSVGFGTPLLRWVDKYETEYVIAAIPLGGYVKMLDEREDNVPTDMLPFSFNQKSAWRRTAIVSAGPIANFLLAILTYWIVFVMGVPGYKPVIGEVQPGSVAEQAGFFPGYNIVQIDHNEIVSRSDVNMSLIKRLGDSGDIVFKLQAPDSNEVLTTSIKINSWLVGDENPAIYTALGFSFWRPVLPPIVSGVVADLPAEKGGMQTGDRIISISGQYVNDWQDVGQIIQARLGETVEVRVDREGQLLTLPIAVLDSGENRGRIGITSVAPEIPDHMLVVERSGFFQGLTKGVEKTWDMILFTLDSVKKMLSGLISPKNLGGPVTIAKIASASAQSGVASYMQILALLSISLGVFNLLPIPVLDGGHLLIIAVESLIRRPLPDKLLIGFQQTGLLLILFVMAFAIYNDIARL